MRAAVANAHAVDDDGAHLAVKHLVGARDFFFQSSGDRHHFESRSGFINIAYGVVLQGLGSNFLTVIWIECGAIGERQDFAGMWILDDHRTGNGFGLLHAALEFAFGDGLDVFVDGQDEILAGIWLLLDTSKPALAGVDGDHQTSGLALQLRIELTLEAAQSLIVGANIAEDLGGQLALGIETLGLLLKVDSLKIQRPYALGHLRIRLARYPAKRLVGPAIGEHHSRIILRDPRNQADSIGEVGRLRRHDECRIDLDRHCQLTPRAIVDNPAFR